MRPDRDPIAGMRRRTSHRDDLMVEAHRALYSDEAGLSMSRGRPAASPIADVVDQLLPALSRYRAGADDLGELRSRWPDLIGRDLARLCTPDAIQGPALDVAVANSAALWLLQTQHLARIQSAVLAATGNRVRVVHLRPAGRRLTHP